jgi:hypothetical protein
MYSQFNFERYRIVLSNDQDLRIYEQNEMRLDFPYSHYGLFRTNDLSIDDAFP